MQHLEATGEPAVQRRLGIKISVGRAPKLGELADAIGHSGVSLVRLELQ